MPSRPLQRPVTSGEVVLAAYEHSPAGPDRPTVVPVHGYPDQHDVWDALVERLPLDHWHVVTYDVRGTGSSTAPRATGDHRGYRTERLVDDLVAVLDAFAPTGAVHLVGHDWGSVQLWDAVAAEPTDPRLSGRIASFTSVSGPSLDHAGRVLRLPRGRRLAGLRQVLHSWYIVLFRVPVLPELVWRHGWRRIATALEQREGLPRGHWGSELRRNAVNGLGLYRANVFPRTRRPGRLRTGVPVLVVHPVHDNYLTDVLLADLDDSCSDVRVERVDAGHWAVVTHPDELAALVEKHVREHG